jgi:multimeric flavodoxin WrbA
MLVLGISGTPRPKGNSEYLLQYALDPFHENGWQAIILKLSELRVNPCDGCDSCLESGECYQNDDMTRFYPAFADCQAL